MHEVYPGHYLHFQHLRQINSKLRKSLMTMPMSVVEGWAHYAEHLAIESGLRSVWSGDDDRLNWQKRWSLARLIVAIRPAHRGLERRTGRPVLPEAAFLEEGSARKEAESGDVDPGYGVYALGKLILMKLRKDVQASRGPLLAEGLPRHVLGLGGLRYPLQREALLGPEAGPSGVAWIERHASLRVDARRRTAAASRSSRVLRRDPDGLPDLRRPVRKLISSPAIQFKGSGFYITDYARKSGTDAGKESKGSPTSSSSSDSGSSSGEAPVRQLVVDPGHRQHDPHETEPGGYPADGVPSWPGRP